MFRLYQTGPTRGDCTSPYEVTMDKEYTVNEFIQEIFTRKEWGYIGIYSFNDFFGDPKCEYRDDELLYSLPNEYLNKKVVKAKADGGWSRMDYLLWIE